MNVKGSMMAQAKVSTFSPTVLVVEDDPRYRNYLRRKFHERTSVGVIMAKDIHEGLQLSRTIRFDALLTDLYFADGADAPDLEMYDGVDLATAIAKDRQVSTYVLSVMSTDQTYHDRAKNNGLQVKGWLPKDFRESSQPDEPSAPWLIVETDLLHEHLGTDNEGEVSNDTVTSLARRLRRPVRTYIQSLPDQRFKVDKPIEVICSLDEGLARATASGLGLLQDAFGESIEDSLTALAELIQGHFEELTGSGAEAVDYAAEVRDRLKEFVSEVPRDEN